MKPIRQLLRQPVKTALGVLLLTLAAAALCVCVGQSWTAAQTRAAVEKGYTTVAITTRQYLPRNEITGMISSLEQPAEVQEYITGLPQTLPDVVQGISYNQAASAVCAQMDPIPVGALFCVRGNGGSVPQGNAYQQGFFEMELTEIGDPTKWSDDPILGAIGGQPDKYLFVRLTGTILRTVALNRHYDDPAGRTVHVGLQIASPESLRQLGLEVGKRYLVYGNTYRDLDWEMRSYGAYSCIAGGKNVDPKEFDWERDIDWSRTIPEDAPGGEAVAALLPPDHEEGYGLYMKKENVLYCNASHLVAYADPLETLERDESGNVKMFRGEETIRISPDQWLEDYNFPGIQEITTTAEDILESDPLWNRTFQELETNNHVVPVLGTDRVEGMLQFVTGKTLITEGRSFTQAEYQAGSPVCLISETMAQGSGLNVGDSLRVSLYDPIFPDYSMLTRTFYHDSNPDAARYRAAFGFAQEEDFQIVGLYRQTNEWDDTLGTFTPLTVLVPNASLHCETYTADQAVFSTILLKNGTGDRLLADAEAAGFPELFVIQDQGYSEIAAALDGYAKAAGSLLWIGIGVFLAVTALYLIFYPLAMGRQARQMWELGTPKGDIFRSLLLGGGFPAAAGGLLAIPLSVLGNRWLLTRLTQGGESGDFTVSVTAPQLTLLCVLAAAALLLLTALCAWLITRRSEKE